MREDTRNGDEVISGALECSPCNRSYPIEGGIPRFVEADNYASSFGFQWNAFAGTQLDSNSGLPISADRLFQSTSWDWTTMRGKRILDVGCGAGRFAEVALQSGASVIGVDFSSAVEASRKNLACYPFFEGVQASIYELPFVPGSFDYVYCLGVLQHTPDPDLAFACLPPQLKPGGALAIDIYPRLWTNIFWSKYWLRPLTRRVPNEALFHLVLRATPPLLWISRRVSSLPLAGRKLKYLLPVVNYEGVYALDEKQMREWAVLDTFDMLSPEHDHPRSERIVRQWFTAAGLQEVVVFRKGHLIGRGRKSV